ncbi:MAG TPA: integration host factor subunit alpha [Gammaproteobacteria bacterium]|nr:integration host factor subunit alpha [Gammaproteobacteria bacterium]
MTTLTKADLTEKLNKEIGLTRGEVEKIIENFFQVVSSTLEAGEPVKLSGFGNFNLIDKSQRPGRNPKTGKEVPISERRVVTFKAGNKLKAHIAKAIKENETKD